jgi:hypothetical protein
MKLDEFMKTNMLNKEVRDAFEKAAGEGKLEDFFKSLGVEATKEEAEAFTKQLESLKQEFGKDQK